MIIGRCSAGVIAIVIATTATAAADGWSLIVDGECADVEAFRARAETQRVRPGAVDGVAVAVALAPVADRWHVRIDITGADGATVTRELDGATCAAVDDAAILIVAGVLDGAARPVPPPVPPRVMERIPGADEPARAPSLAEPVSVRVGAAIGADIGALPSATAGGRLMLEVGWWRAVGAFGVARWREVTDLDDRGEGLSVAAWQLVAALRFRVARRVELGPQFEIGQLDARGRGVDTELTGSGSWQAIGGVGRVQVWGWRDLDVALQIEVLAPLGAPTFLVDGEPRYRPGVTVRAMVTATWTLFDGTRRILAIAWSWVASR